jgi:hypothetical protein
MQMSRFSFNLFFIAVLLLSAGCRGLFSSPADNYPQGDINLDCKTDFKDYSFIAANHDGREPQSAENRLRSYQVYEPVITRAFISNAAVDPLQHNNGPAITFYRGLFYAVWYGSEEPVEAAPGQRIFVSTSHDAVEWSEPVSFTPDMPSSLQWQPGLLNYNNDRILMCFWTHHFGTGVYLSSLGEPESGWTNRNILGKVSLDGTFYNPFVSGNPIVLESGRIAVPVIIQEDGVSDWYIRRKYAGILFSDNGGRSWDLNRNSLVQAPENIYSIWENTYIQQYDGKVRMFARNNDAQSASETLITAAGDENGENFAPSTFSGLRTVRSRPGTCTAPGRYYMFHCDNPSVVSWREDRMNLALYCSRSGMDDFVAGIPIVNDEPTLVYPQGFEKDGKLYVIYCGIYDNLPLHVKTAILDPAPDKEKYYLFCRSQTRNLTDHDPPGTEKRITHITDGGRDWLLFYGNAAAGVDVDIIEPQTSVLTVVLPVLVESSVSSSMIRLLSLGDNDLILGYDSVQPDILQVRIEGTWHRAVSFQPGQWNKILLTVSSREVVIRNASAVSVHQPPPDFSGRLYIGDGFPDDFLDAGSRFYVDTSAFHTKVEQYSETGICGDSEHDYPVGDLNYDCNVDWADIKIMAESWLETAINES